MLLNYDLRLTFVVGLAPTKVVAKIASKWQKPAGLTIIPGTVLHEYLPQVALEEVWGIGPQTTAYLTQFGFKTALDLARQSELWVRKKLTKPHVEIWHELRGTSVIPLQTEAKQDYQSISKRKTFTPPTADREFLLAQLSKNVENACIKARRYHLQARRVFFLLRTQGYRHYGFELTLCHPTAMPHVIIALMRQHFDRVYRADYTYRMTGIILSDVRGEGETQLDLFGEVARAERARAVYEAIDQLDAKYGKHTVFLGSSYAAITGVQHQGKRGKRPRRQGILLKREATVLFVKGGFVCFYLFFTTLGRHCC